MIWTAIFSILRLGWHDGSYFFCVAQSISPVIFYVSASALDRLLFQCLRNTGHKGADQLQVVQERIQRRYVLCRRCRWLLGRLLHCGLEYKERGSSTGIGFLWLWDAKVFQFLIAYELAGNTIPLTFRTVLQLRWKRIHLFRSTNILRVIVDQRSSDIYYCVDRNVLHRVGALEWRTLIGFVRAETLAVVLRQRFSLYFWELH